MSFLCGPGAAAQDFDEGLRPGLPEKESSSENAQAWYWNPSYKYEEDNFQREYWQTRQQLGYSWRSEFVPFLEYVRTSFREQGILPVKDNAWGVGARGRLNNKHAYVMRALQHSFSQSVKEQTSFLVDLQSDWNSTWQTRVRAGREPLETAQALLSNLDQGFLETEVTANFWTRWHAYARGELGRLSDKNRLYSSDWQLSYDIPGLTGFQALVLYQFDNMKERRPQYYSPGRVKSYQAGLSYYGTPTEKTWVWGRYIPGYGKEQGVETWFVQVVDFNAGLEITEDFDLEFGLGWSRSPTYRSRTYKLKGNLEF
ncbi:MAG: hypothetical protein JW937_08895 [Candidatus Omnitrophica bacterium]|nr:hypothetical protein [Candidatus Omnitrophota bacterium]